MKKIIIILIFTLLLTVGGCSKTETFNYTYRGENELWSAEYRQIATGRWSEENDSKHFENQAATTLTVIYKKDLSELSSVKDIVIAYDGVSGGGKLSQNIDEPLTSKVFTLKGGTKNGALETKDSVIKVTIEVDGNIQMLELKYDD